MIKLKAGQIVEDENGSKWTIEEGDFIEEGVIHRCTNKIAYALGFCAEKELVNHLDVLNFLRDNGVTINRVPLSVIPGSKLTNKIISDWVKRQKKVSPNGEWGDWGYSYEKGTLWYTLPNGKISEKDFSEYNKWVVTVRQLGKSKLKGLYYFGIRNHVMLYFDGMLIDTAFKGFYQRSLIDTFFEIKNKNKYLPAIKSYIKEFPKTVFYI